MRASIKSFLVFATLLFHAAPNTQAAVPTPQIWFGMSAVKTPAGRQNWDRIFLDPNASWPEILSHVNVIIATEQALNQLSEDELAKVVFRLNQHHIKLTVAVLAQNWVNEQKCGYGIEGYSDPGTNAKLAAKMQRAGAQVSYIGMDEPLFFGHYYNGKNACRSSIENVAQRVSIILHEYLKVYSNATVIDTEPFPAISNQPGWRDDYERWMKAYRAAVGQSIGNLNIDINWPPRWQQTLGSVMTVARDLQLSVGIIYWANPSVLPGTDITNELWLNSAVQNYTQIEQTMHIVPDRAIFTSWSKFPWRSITDKNGLGEDYLVSQYLLMRKRP